MLTPNQRDAAVVLVLGVSVVVWLGLGIFYLYRRAFRTAFLVLVLFGLVAVGIFVLFVDAASKV